MQPGAAPSQLERQLLGGLVAFRGAAWLWMAVTMIATRSFLDRPALAVAFGAVALATTAATTFLVKRSPGTLLGVPAVAVETVVAASLPGADGFIYASNSPQTLGSAWPLGAVLAGGVAAGPRGGLAGGAIVGGARIAGANAEEAVVSRLSSAVLYVLAGVVAGLVADRLRRAERAISAARAREEVARTLHDGVLQTLAIVQRRATDPDVARLAHEQERDLRAFLFGPSDGGSETGELGPALRMAAARFEDRHAGRAEVVLAPDLPTVAPVVVEAVSGAVGEALTNAAKHGDARRVTIYAEPADGGGVFCSVKDDGAGFDPTVGAEGVGISQSIRARIAEVGGRVEIDGNLGRGTEVRIWVGVNRRRERR